MDRSEAEFRAWLLLRQHRLHSSVAEKILVWIIDHARPFGSDWLLELPGSHIANLTFCRPATCHYAIGKLQGAGLIERVFYTAPVYRVSEEALVALGIPPVSTEGLSAEIEAMQQLAEMRSRATQKYTEEQIAGAQHG